MVMSDGKHPTSVRSWILAVFPETQDQVADLVGNFSQCGHRKIVWWPPRGRQ
jgi:hypothetical protein